MKKIFLLAALLLTSPVLAQNVQYVSPVTRNHVPVWNTNGVIADGGSSADSPITSLGVTNNGGAGFCVSSDRQTAVARNQLCFGASTSSAATISLQNYGTAVAQNLNFVINGVTVTIPTGGGTFLFGNGPFSTGNVPCFANTSGVIQDCGATLVAGTFTSGVWSGTPIDIAHGGTGGTSQATARAALGLGSMATQNASAVAITGGTVTGMPSPSNATDVANKAYVDSTASGLNILAASTLATAVVLPNSPTYSNGTLGVGATLTAGSNTTLTVDGTAAPLNTVVLVKNQASAFQNGIYTVTTAGSGAAAWVLTRATYFDQAAEMKAGSYTFISAGATNVNSSWTQQAAVATVGTDASNWALFSSNGASVASIGGSTGVITLTNGLQIAGNALGTSVGVSTGIVGTVSGTTPLSSTNCGLPVYAGNNTFYTVSAGAASGFTDKCLIEIFNTDVYTGIGTGRGKTIAMSGVTSFILYPQQYVRFRNVSSAWACEVGCTTAWVQLRSVKYFVDTAGSNTAGVSDGLAAAASAFATRGYCAAVAYLQTFATGGVVCSVTAGQATQEFVQVFYQLPGGGTLTFEGNGGQAEWRPANGGYALQIGDNALVGITNQLFTTTGVTSPVGYIIGHQWAVLDANTSITMNTGGLSGSMFSCDEETHFNINNGITIVNAVSAASGFVYAGCPKSVWNINGTQTFSGNPTIGRWSNVPTTAVMTYQGNVAFSGSVSTSVSLLSGNGVINNLTASALPGGNPTGTTGGQYCTGVC